MICKWQVKNPLTIEERIKIKEAIDRGMSYGEMALFVGRSKTTMRRECARLGKFTKYNPHEAQQHFEKTQKQKLKSAKK